MTDEKFTCTVRGDATGGTTFEITGAKPVLLEMVARSVAVIPVGCRGGGCGVCRVEVLSGDYDTKRMSRRHVTEADEAAGYALACRLMARSDLVVRTAPSDPVT